MNDQTLDSYFDQCSMDGKMGFKGTFWNNREMNGKPVTITQEKNPVQVTTYGQHSFAPNVKLVGFSANMKPCSVLSRQTRCCSTWLVAVTTRYI